MLAEICFSDCIIAVVRKPGLTVMSSTNKMGFMCGSMLVREPRITIKNLMSGFDISLKGTSHVAYTNGFLRDRDKLYGMQKHIPEGL